jgi:hypothetical protein
MKGASLYHLFVKGTSPNFVITLMLSHVPMIAQQSPAVYQIHLLILAATMLHTRILSAKMTVCLLFRIQDLLSNTILSVFRVILS